MRNLFTHLLLQVHSNQTNETQSRQNRIESFSRRSRDILESFSSVLPQLRVSLRTFLLASTILMGAGNVWGADFTPQQIIDGATSGNITVSSVIATSTSDQKVCNTSVSTVSIDGTANGDGDTKYIEIQADAGYVISSLSIDASINKTDGGTYKIGIAFFEGTYTTTVTDKAEIVVACKNATSGCGPYNISVPSGIRTVRIYRGVKINASNEFNGSGTLYGSGQNTYVAGISATATTSSCPTPTATRGGTEATPAGGVTLGTVLEPLTCTATGTSVTYQWKQYPVPGGTPGTAVAAEGTGATTASFVPTPSVAGTYIYFCTVTDACSNSVSTSESGAFQFNTPPTHTLTVTTNNGLYGSVSPTSATVAENATTEITATPGSGYVFDHWTVSGTGATLSSTTTNPTTFTMGTANATVTAYFEESSCPTYGTVFSLQMGNNDTEVVLTASQEVDLDDYATITGGSATFTNTGSAKGKITKANPALINFDGNAAYVILDFECPIQTGDTIKVTNATSVEMAFTTTATLGTTYQTTTSEGIGKFIVPAALNNISKLYCWRATGSGLKFSAINITRPLSCVAPSGVDIVGTWDRFGGETLVLTATPDGGQGTPSYQWKHNGVNIAGATSATYTKENCSVDDGGTYTCVVSTGADCTPVESDGFDVKVYSLQKYTGGTTTYNFTRTGEKTGTVEVTLAANTNSEFKIYDGGNYYGNDEGNITIDGNRTFTTSGNNVTLASGLGGTFTFDIDYTVGYAPVLTITYPRKTIYLQLCSDWKAAIAKYAIYYWKGGDNGWSDFMTTDACDADLRIGVVPAWAVNCIFGRFDPSKASSDSWDDLWNQTGDLTLSASNDYYHTLSKGGDNKYYGSWGTYVPPTFTISFNAGGGTGSMSNLTGIACDNSQTLTANTFTRTNYIFVGWHADVATTIGGSPVAAGALISDGATLQHITSNITLTAQWKPHATVYAFPNGNVESFGICGSGASLTLVGSQSGVNYQLYKNGVIEGEPKAGTGSALTWTGLGNGSYQVKSVENASYAESTMDGTAVVILQDPTISGETTVAMGETITLTLPNYTAVANNWVSSNTSVATVSASGVVTGVAPGTVTITFHGVEGCDGTISITVTNNCEKIFWFAKAADATTAGVTNNTSFFSGTSSGSTSVSGSITIDGTTYTVTGRGSNNTTDITFTVPANKRATLYGLASSNGTTARTLTLTGTSGYSATQQTSASSSTAAAFTFESLTPGDYTMSWSGSGAEAMLCIETCPLEIHTVTYKPNGVSGSDIVDASASIIAANTFTPLAGYVFDSWNTAADGSGTTYYPGTPVLSDLTLYAQWKVECGEWNGTPSSFTSNTITSGSLILSTGGSGTTTTSTAVWSGSGNKTVIQINGNAYYIEGHLSGEKEIESITIGAANSASAGNDRNYAILYCANSSFSSGVTYEEYASPSKSDAENDEKLLNEFTPPAGTKYFRIYRQVANPVDEGTIGAGQTTYIYHVEICPTPPCTETTMDVSNATPTYSIGGAAFTRPTFTVKAGGVALDPQPTLTYSSSNPDIATVNATTGEVTFQGVTGSVTITATCERDLVYCASTGSYTITVTCAGEDAPLIVADGSTLDGCGTVIHLWAKQQDGMSSFLGGTYKWYRDGEEIEGATNDYYNVERAGTYTVVRTGSCVQASTNSAVVTSVAEEPTVERLVPFQYYHAGKTYSAQMKDRHLFAVASQGLLAGKPYSMTATSGGADVLASVAGALWLKPGEIIGSEQMPDTVMLDLNELSSAGFSAGDEIRFVCSAIACGGVSPINDDIVLKVVDATPTMAFICSGADGDGTRVKSELKLNGDFLTGYNKADLCLQTDLDDFDEDAELPLYTYLKARYRITPVNGYAPFKKLNYEPFDILLLTDYPKAKLGGDYKTPTSRRRIATDKLDSMSVLADYRPMLSFKTHMVSEDKMKAGITPQWAAKGFTTEPTVPKAKPQVAMNIVCFAHPMFNALEIGAGGVFRDHDEPDQVVYEMLSDGGYDDNKGIQGFELGDAGNFMVIAFTHWNAKVGTPSGDEIAWNISSGDRKLISSCERQVNPEARLLLISINADALCMLTAAGMAVVDSALQYLLITDPNKIADCSLTFDDNHGTGVWSDELNWAPRYNQVPNADLGARIIKPCTVDNASAITLSVRMHDDGKLIIPATSALNVISTVRHDEDGVYTPPSTSEIDIKATSTGSGTLILANPDGDTQASVEMYSKAVNSGGTTTWQYITTPFNDVTNAMLNYYESWLYVYNSSTSGWDAIPKGGALTPFAGYCITHPEEGHLYRMSGTLAETGSQGIKVPAGKYMVVGNAWTAPIQIANFDDDDLEDIPVKSIYFFNTGSDPDKTGTLVDDPDASARWAAHTYISIPIHSAPFTGDSIISAMQGFYVDNTSGGSEGTLHLQYDKLVRPKNSRQNIVSGPLHAPRRIAAVDDEPTVAKLWVCGSHYDDRLVVLEREDFTRGYDPGWDGEKWEGNAIAPMVYAINGNNGQDAVAAVPDMEGTVVGFKAGEDEEYTFRFNYSSEAEELYLLDTETMLYTRVLTGNTYYFSTNDKAYHNRFILTRTSGSQTPTGCENITGETDNAVKFINNNKMFIFVRGILYDATGKVIKQSEEAK